jgi:predicted dienelactone hydrolase
MGENKLEIFVGTRQFQIRDENNDISFPVLVQYPTHTPSVSTNFGPYLMDVSPNADIMEGQFPLVIISHGNGGSHLLYRTISTYLAKSGYIVAMLEHYGNNRNNNELENTIKNLQYRPKHVRLTIDKMLSDQLFGKYSIKDKIAIIGHSMGGYTALALAGGIPRTRDGVIIETVFDSRIKLIILLAPGAGWFMNGLNNVKISILVLTAEHDPITPSKEIEAVFNSMLNKSLVTFKQIVGAGHFSFLSPFPVAMKSLNFQPSTDPEGFDRAEFHKRLPIELLDYLNNNL